MSALTPIGFRSALSFRSALDKAVQGRDLDREEITSLLSASDAEVEDLYRAADEVRARYLGDEVHLRGIIEFSDHCRRNCLYCGIRAGNSRVQRYRIEPDEIVEVARRAYGLGYRTVVLQSGEDPWYTAEMIAGIVRRIKSQCDLAVTLSIGERSREEYAVMKAAGADRYLMRHETSDPELFARLRPGTTLGARVERLRWLRELGYQVGSGHMVGLPGQTAETLAGDILLLRELDVEMAGIGPFIPHPDTPLASSPGGTIEDTLKVVAVTRLVLPWAHLPSTTAVGSIDAQGRQKALRCGANVIMPNVTPGKYREGYQLYPHKICLAEEPEHCRPCVEGIIRSLGRRVGADRGDSPKRGPWLKEVPAR